MRTDTDTTLSVIEQGIGDWEQRATTDPDRITPGL